MLSGAKTFFVHTVYSGDGELLALTKFIVRWWKDFFEDLLDSTSMYSLEEAELENSEWGSLITGIVVAERVKQPFSGGAPEETQPELLKALDVL